MIDPNFPTTLALGDKFFVGYIEPGTGKRYKLYRMVCTTTNGIFDLWAAVARINCLHELLRSTARQIPRLLCEESLSNGGNYAQAIRDVFDGLSSFVVWVER